jgi:ankyrin repeat protein
MNGRRVFTETAAALLKVRPELGKASRLGWARACCAIAQVFEAQNASFDAQRYLTDCGLTVAEMRRPGKSALLSALYAGQTVSVKVALPPLRTVDDDPDCPGVGAGSRD